MPYPEALVEPMRQELTRIGVTEMKTAEEVDRAFKVDPDTTSLVVINSVCGCAAANARPAVNMAKNYPAQPDRYLTVFAGQDLEATARLRDYLPGIPPSSPFIAVMKGRDPVFVLERRNIEGRTASAIASDIVNAFDSFSNGEAAEASSGDSTQQPDSDIPDTFRSIL
ncbi:MAG: BrxA/BrxB family bacilliredoxin [Rhodothermales bacterium]|nr:BrxA/BrxB family bacilliredoxin [Rhodothermales bacterium]